MMISKPDLSSEYRRLTVGMQAINNNYYGRNASHQKEYDHVKV